MLSSCVRTWSRLGRATARPAARTLSQSGAVRDPRTTLLEKLQAEIEDESSNGDDVGLPSKARHAPPCPRPLHAP